jgi:hypothetical protein
MIRFFDRLWNEGDRCENMAKVFFILFFVATLIIISYLIATHGFGKSNRKGEFGMEGDLTPQIILSNPMNMP